MASVLVELQLRPAVEEGDVDVVEVVADLDVLVESSKCSCNAGDDNPF